MRLTHPESSLLSGPNHPDHSLAMLSMEDGMILVFVIAFPFSVSKETGRDDQKLALFLLVCVIN